MKFSPCALAFAATKHSVLAPGMQLPALATVTVYPTIFEAFGEDFQKFLPVVPPETTEIKQDLAKGDTVDQKEKKKTTKSSLGWEEKFALLRAFKKIHGHCRVPKGYVVGGIKLYGWVVTQRKEFMQYHLGFLSYIINEKRIRRLDRVGFDWSLAADAEFLGLGLSNNAAFHSSVAP